MSNKTKSTIFKILSMLTFGIFSYWFMHKYNVEFFSIEYGVFFFLSMVLILFEKSEYHFIRKDKEETKKILDIFENAKDIYKKKESN